MLTSRATCRECSAKPLPGKRRCAECTELHRLREALRRALRRSQGLCVVCGQPAVIDDNKEPMSLCDQHRLEYEVRRLAQKKRREKENGKRATSGFRRVRSGRGFLGPAN